MSCGIQGLYESGKKFFRTWPNVDHNKDYPYFTVKSEEINPQSSKESYFVNLNKTDIMNRFKRLKKKITDSSNMSSNTNKDNIKTTTKRGDSGISLTPVIDPDAPVLEKNERQARVETVNCQNLSNRYIGKTVILYGKIKEFQIGDDEVNCILNTDNEIPAILHFYETFRNDGIGIFDFLKRTANYIVSKELDVTISCYGFLEKRNDQ